jgi:hypothetical protein
MGNRTILTLTQFQGLVDVLEPLKLVAEDGYHGAGMDYGCVAILDPTAAYSPITLALELGRLMESQDLDYYAWTCLNEECRRGRVMFSLLDRSAVFYFPNVVVGAEPDD